MNKRVIINRIKKLKGIEYFAVSTFAPEIFNKYLKRHVLRKKLRLKRAIICYRNERHSLFGLFLNKKKRLSIV